QRTQRHREAPTDLVDAGAHAVITLAPHGLGVGPAGGDIDGDEGGEGEAFSTLAAMADEIGLETGGGNDLPLAEGADGARGGEGGGEGGMAGAGGGEAMGMVSPMRAQETINRRGANAQEGRAQGGRDLEYLVALEGLDEGGQERGEAFAAEIVAGFPDAVQER